MDGHIPIPLQIKPVSNGWQYDYAKVLDGKYVGMIDGSKILPTSACTQSSLERSTKE